MELRFIINSFEERQSMVLAFANSGYKVYVEKPGTIINGARQTDYVVCVEYNKKVE